MPYVLRLVGAATGEPTLIDGAYVALYDPDANDGRGLVVPTWDARAALPFETTAAAADCWAQVAAPPHDVRWDGKANRPLTAFTVEILPAP